MLSKGDKESIRKMIREEFKKALFREITIEKRAKSPGEVDGKIETSTENMLDMLVVSLPQWAQSMGLVEAAAVKSTDRSTEAINRLNAMVDVLSSMQDSVMTMARFAVALKETGLLEQLEKALVIDMDPKAIDHEASTG